MLNFSSTYTDIPWCCVGDFNVITATEEKKGGVPYNMKKCFEFISVIEGCGLVDLGFIGQKFTWYNYRGPLFKIWKRHDRTMVNDKWLEIMPLTTVTHLSSVGSDHCPLLVEMATKADNTTRYFKFLNSCVDELEFMDVVQKCWERPIHGNVMWIFHQKLQRLAKTLSTWSRSHFGDIHVKVRDFEEKIRIVEEEMIMYNS